MTVPLSIQPAVNKSMIMRLVLILVQFNLISVMLCVTLFYMGDIVGMGVCLFRLCLNRMGLLFVLIGRGYEWLLWGVLLQCDVRIV